MNIPNDKHHHSDDMHHHSVPHQSQDNNGHNANHHDGDTGHKHAASHTGHDHHMMMVQNFKRRFVISLVITLPILLLSPMIQGFLGFNLQFPGSGYVLFALATILFVFGGKPFFTGAVDELKKKSPAMMTLIAFAISVSYVYSALTLFVLQGNDFFWELATLITIMLLGHWIEMKSVMGASMALEELAKLLPDVAHVVGKDGETMDVSVQEIKRGDIVVVKPGEKIPIDGVVIDGGSAVNESMITGESLPVNKHKGDKIIGGSVNGEGVLKFEVHKVGTDTFLSQVIQLVRQAQASKSKTQTLADTAAKWLFYIALCAGSITFIVWLLAGYDISFTIERTVTVIVICCPHALGLAIPLVTAVSTSIGARHGLLIRNRAAFEYARKLDTVVFDKTGTLTEGRFGVTDVGAMGISNEELLALACSVEENSEHLIAQGIVKEGKRLNLTMMPAKNHKVMPGQGIQAEVDDKKITVTSPGYLEQKGISYDQSEYEKLAEQGKTVVFVLEGDNLLGYIALSDIVRDTAKEAVGELKSMKIEPIMLTGDNNKAANYVAKQLQIDRVFAEVLPQQKADTIDALRREGRMLAMTGDGINDAPSLAKADLGIAIGAGTDIAIETADVILVKSNPQDIVGIIKLSKAIFRKMTQNLIWATAYNIVALPLAAGVLYNAGIVLNPAVGAVLMSLSTIIVAINARLIKIK